MSDRKPNNLILEDRLLHSTPEAVYAWVESANKEAWKERFSRDYDEQIELTLLDRGDPLIELGIAQFGSSQAALNQIWSKTAQAQDKHSGHSRALRLAILSNQNIGQTFGTQLITTIGVEVFPDFLENATNEELDAMGQNPRLPFLEALYEKTGAFERLSDDRWCDVISSTIGNPILSEKYDDKDDYDGFMTYKRSCVPRAIYKLPARVPATKEWAATLAWLMEKTLPELPFKYTVADLDTTIARWQVPLFEMPDDGTWFLDPCAHLRTYFGRLYFSYSIKRPPEEVMASDDLAVRCAAYAWAELTPEQIKAGAAKDKKDFVEWACSNKNLCRSKALRAAVRDAAREYGDEELHELQRFSYVCDEQRKQNPYWFKDEQEEDEPFYEADPADPMSPVLQDLSFLKGKVDRIFGKVDTVHVIAIGFSIAAIWQMFFK